MKYEAGSVVRFTYRHHTGAGSQELTDDHKEILVLQPLWQNKLHGIDLKRLSPAERLVLQSVFDQQTVQDHKNKKLHRLPLVNDILNRMDPIEECKNPLSFYHKFVRVFIQNKDCYRTFYPRKMRSVTTLNQSAVQGDVSNPKPLFHAVKSKGPMPTQKTEPLPRSMDVLNKAMKTKGQVSGAEKIRKANPSDRLSLIKQRAAALKAAKNGK